MSVWAIVLMVAGAIFLTAILTFFMVRRRDNNKVTYMLDAFEDGELNFRFKENTRYNRTLNRIRWIWERHRQHEEQESWSKLIRVLTHEIMNTVSPIASLSEVLSHAVENPEQTATVDVKVGLETISSASKELIQFVESYRSLAGVARPIKKALMLSDLMERVINLTSEQCAVAGAKCSYTAFSDDILLYADEGQISQIMVNLIKNALQAGATSIDITAQINADEQVSVLVTNNGTPISGESREQIFVPFFTTKSDGNGIGLSISRQIMNLHNGCIDLVESNTKQTVFKMIFK